MRSRTTYSWKDRKFNTVLQGSCGSGSEWGVMGAGSGIVYRSDRGAGPGGEIPGSRQARSRGMNGIPVLGRRRGAPTAAPRGIEREHVRKLAAVTARAGPPSLGPSSDVSGPGQSHLGRRA